MSMKGSATMEMMAMDAIEMSSLVRSSARCSVKVISTSSEAGRAAAGTSAVCVDIDPDEVL